MWNIVPVSELSWYFSKSVQFNNPNDLLAEREGWGEVINVWDLFTVLEETKWIDWSLETTLRIGKVLWDTWVSGMGEFLLQAQNTVVLQLQVSHHHMGKYSTKTIWMCPSTKRCINNIKEISRYSLQMEREKQLSSVCAIDLVKRIHQL